MLFSPASHVFFSGHDLDTRVLADNKQHRGGRGEQRHQCDQSTPKAVGGWVPTGVVTIRWWIFFTPKPGGDDATWRGHIFLFKWVVQKPPTRLVTWSSCGCFLKWWYPKSSILIGFSIYHHKICIFTDWVTRHKKNKHQDHGSNGQDICVRVCAIFLLTWMVFPQTWLQTSTAANILAVHSHRIFGTGIFTYIYHTFEPNVGKYTSCMDPIRLKNLEKRHSTGIPWKLACQFQPTSSESSCMWMMSWIFGGWRRSLNFNLKGFARHG